MSSEKFCLKWNDFQSNVHESFKKLRIDTDFCDVTLVSEGNQQVNAHKVILAASSPIFMKMLKDNKHSNPLIYMREIKINELAAIVDFMYHGEVNVYQEDLDAFLALAEELKLKGLTGGGGKEENQTVEIMKDKELGPRQPIKPEPLHSNEPVDSNLDDRGHVALISEKQLFLGNTTDDNLTEQLDTIIESQGSALTCKVCHKPSKKRQDARRHAETHIQGVSHPCNICGKLYRSTSSLKMHQHRHHK